MAISKALIASLLISLLVLQLVQADVENSQKKNGYAKKIGFRGGRGCVTERAGLAATGATVCLRVRTETTTSASATLASPPTVDAASAHKKKQSS
ncbi:unnamed protein product [Arabidopsis thaliana]|uniref:(thale cress) hypothetical protein n=1 Tax=Arabidopsis thaliana TaxID=3702 RepID=A0A7G2E7J3_ARATH|nr:unnamed protein product [Arabidopsis thaliana]